MSPAHESNRHRALICAAALAFLAGCGAGCRGSAIATRLADAVASGDHGKVAYEFSDAVYSTIARMSLSLPAMRQYLAHPDPFVRLTAARYLYLAGDVSGYETLVELVQSPQPLLEVNNELVLLGLDRQVTHQDLRAEAAAILGQYRQREAVPAVRALAERDPSPRVREALARLGLRLEPPGVNPFRRGAAVYYGVINAREHLPALVASFEQPGDPEVKLATAWALARMTGEARYVNYAAGVARQAFDPNADSHYRHPRIWKSLRSLGSLDDPAAHEVLEEALDSPFPEAVEVAVVNLLLNSQAGSEKARQVVLRQLRRQHHMLSWEVVMNVAAALDDTEIQMAGEAFDRSASESPYRAKAVERHNWPLYGWIDEYVLVLGPTPSRVRPERVFGLTNARDAADG